MTGNSAKNITYFTFIVKMYSSNTENKKRLAILQKYFIFIVEYLIVILKKSIDLQFCSARICYLKTSDGGAARWVRRFLFPDIKISIA